MTEPSTLMPTAAELIRNDGNFRAHLKTIASDVELGEIWQALLAGRGVTSQEAEKIILDLVVTSGYFEVAPEDASSGTLQRREGRREIAGRIFFLADLPFSYITKLRRGALDELQKMEARE